MSGISPFTYTPQLADWLRILPELCLLTAVFLTLLADLALPAGRKPWLAVVGFLGVVASAVSLVYVSTLNGDTSAFYGLVSMDGASIFASAIILFALGAGLLFSPGYLERQGLSREGEYYALMQVSALGMMLMASAGSLMVVFVGLETLSLALYVLSALPQTRRRAQEAGMKYFILSSFASAFLLYGIALTYGAIGATRFVDISVFLRSHQALTSEGFGPLLLVGMGLMIVGFSFKVSAVPFQSWTPDVYTGAPTPVTAFMSVGTKMAAFAAIVRVFVVALSSQTSRWENVIWVIAALTMVFGNLLAVSQRDVKRMLSYSSVANAGYILVAVATPTTRATASLLIYLLTYAVANVGAFGVVALVERNDGRGVALDDFAGLSRRNPALAAVMAVFLFSLAGIPPTAGFLGKWVVFYAAIVGGQISLAIIGVLASLLGMYYYLRVVWAMYFVEPQAHGMISAPEPLPERVAVAAGVGEESEPVAEPAPVVRQTLAPSIAMPLGYRIGLSVCAVLTALFIVVSSGFDTFAQLAVQSLLR
ncbi:MAG TPA: NADH-quinone oxidoreductase subunit N [Ktedonobacterales bacterium]